MTTSPFAAQSAVPAAFPADASTIAANFDDGSAGLLEALDLEALDRIAPEALTRGLPSRVVTAIDRLLEFDLDGHPWSQLLAAAACHDTYRGDVRASRLCRQAWGQFERRGDRTGLGVAAHVRANLYLAEGDIPRAVSWWRRADVLLGRHADLNVSVAAHSSLAAYADGDLYSAERSAQEALLLADSSGNPGAAAVPLVYLALYAYCLGEFERATRILETAEAMTASSPVAEVRNEGALVAGFTGVIQATRGLRDDAEASFVTGLDRAESDEAPWYATMVRTLRAEFTAEWAPRRSLDDARRAYHEAESTGDAWWCALARRAEGTALAELGDLVEARDVLIDAAASLNNPLERAVAQTRLGEVLVRLGDRGAARLVLNAARSTCESSGARYWASRTNLALAAADRDRGGRSLRLARGIAADDPAYDRLFDPTQELRISVIGQPEVVLRGERVVFLTRHAELAVFLLAIAGPKGVSASELLGTLWPGVEERRAAPRLRTLLWQARNALGAEAWRLQRRGSMVLLDLTGVAVDLHDSSALDEADPSGSEPRADLPVSRWAAEADRAERDRAEASRRRVTEALDDQGSRAAASGGGSGGGGDPATTLCLLDGWDVELPPSFSEPPLSLILAPFR